MLKREKVFLDSGTLLLTALAVVIVAYVWIYNVPVLPVLGELLLILGKGFATIKG